MRKAFSRIPKEVVRSMVGIFSGGDLFPGHFFDDDVLFDVHVVCVSEVRGIVESVA